MSDVSVIEVTKYFDVYRETLGFMIATAGLGGFMFGFKFGVNATEKRIEPMEDQIKKMDSMIDELRISNREIQRDLRKALLRVYPFNKHKDDDQDDAS